MTAPTLMPPWLAAQELEDIELNLLMEGVLRRYGYELRHFSRNLLHRRMGAFMQNEGFTTLSAFQERILRDEPFMERFLSTLSFGPHAMFRDPGFLLFLRTEILPVLRTYPFLRVWVPGCSSGQEAYSLAVLLEEESLYERTRIYATDMGQGSIAKAKEGAYPLASMRKWGDNHSESGGKGPLSEYYSAEGGLATFRDSLRRNIVFSQHCLPSDGSFNEFNLILCRNVAPAFDAGLKGRIHGLLDQSLALLGYLGVGLREKPAPLLEPRYQLVRPGHKLYRKVG